MQTAVKLALEKLRAEVSQIQEQVIAKVVDVANRTLGKLKEMDSTLADSLKPVFKEKPKWVFTFLLEGDQGKQLRVIPQSRPHHPRATVRYIANHPSR